jgi:hypothetical protein
MRKITWIVLIMSHATLLGAQARAQSLSPDSTRAEMRSLDEQVQEIKSDVLGIAKDLNLLEERLIYPSNTQVAVFVSLDPEKDFRFDAIQIQIDGELVAHYIYSFKELEALENGGVQRVYTGNARTGNHEMVVSVSGKLPNGKQFSSSETFTFNKLVEPAALDLKLAANGGGASIALEDW